ncbi:MAG: hypothetical protein H7062_01095 [Candidatus Saccharimonas sp.]|nr:hypothetical protein [Planctomycetaceae bacterium]
MNDAASSPGNGDRVPEVLRQARRDRWATPLARSAAVLHLFGAFVVFAWYYYIVPHFTFAIDQSGTPISWGVFAQITLSQFVQNNVSMLALFFVPVAIVVSVISYLAHRWLARNLGLTRAAISATVVLFLIDSHVLISYTILRWALP